MAGQAGWYPAPNEAGIVRYWNGEAWTDHRQPMPVAAPPVAQVEEPVVAPPSVLPAAPLTQPSAIVVSSPALANSAEPSPEAPVSEPTSELSATELAMIEFERQFEKQSAEEFAHANSQAQASVGESSVVVAPAPAPVSTEFTSQSRFAPQPTFAPPSVAPQTADVPVQEAPMDKPPVSTVADMWSSVSDQDLEVALAPSRAAAAAIVAPAPLLSPEPPSAPSPSAEAPVFAPALAPAPPRSRSIAPVSKKRSSGGAIGMIVGVVVILVGLGVFGYLAYQAAPEAGESIATGVVTDLGAATTGSGSSTCAPVARFAVLGKSYTAQTSVAVSSCPVSLGQTVSVIYDTKAPATSGRIQVAGPYALLVWLIPLTGLIVFIASLVAFMRSRSKVAPIS